MSRAGLAARVVRRVAAAGPALLGVLCATFILMRVLPGDPAVFFAAGPNAGVAETEQLRRTMGLDRPLPVQLARYLQGLARGELGRSMTTGQPVARDIAARLPASIELTGSALVLALALAIPLGVGAALRPGSVLDHGVRLLCAAGASVPTFVSGLLLVAVFYTWLGWAPDPTARLDVFTAAPPRVTGLYLVDFALARDWPGLRAAAAQLVLPAGTLALFALSPVARVTRGAMLAALGADFVRTARALGLPRRQVIVTYALRNALLPVLTIVGIVAAALLGASVLVETIFAWPGIAAYALAALLAADYAPVQAFILLTAAAALLLNLVVDLLIALLDPRTTLE